MGLFVRYIFHFFVPGILLQQVRPVCMQYFCTCVLLLTRILVNYPQACGKNSITMKDMPLVTDENEEVTAFNTELAEASDALDEANRSIQDSLAKITAIASELSN